MLLVVVLVVVALHGLLHASASSHCLQVAGILSSVLGRSVKPIYLVQPTRPALLCMQCGPVYDLGGTFADAARTAASLVWFKGSRTPHEGLPKSLQHNTHPITPL